MGEKRTAAEYLKLLRKVEKDPNFVPKDKKKKGKKAKGDSRKPVGPPLIPLADLPKMLYVLSAMPVFIHGGKNGVVQQALSTDAAKEYWGPLDDGEPEVRLHSVDYVFANPDVLDVPGIVMLTDLNKHVKNEVASNQIMSLLWRTGYKARLIGCVNVDKIDAHATMRAIHIHLKKDESWANYPF